MRARAARSRTLAVDPAELVEPGRGDTISRLRTVGADGTTISVLVGRVSVAKIDARDLEALGLAPGDAWTPDLAARLHEAASALAARRHALRLVAARPRARADLIRRLRLAGHRESHAAAAAEALAASGIIDDTALAEATATSLAGRAGTPRRAIETKLRKRGIAAPEAAQAARAATEDLDERQAALDLARKRVSRQRPPTDPQAARRRLYAFLLRRGFDADDARHAVERALAGDADELD